MGLGIWLVCLTKNIKLDFHGSSVRLRNFKLPLKECRKKNQSNWIRFQTSKVSPSFPLLYENLNFWSKLALVFTTWIRINVSEKWKKKSKPTFTKNSNFHICKYKEWKWWRNLWRILVVWNLIRSGFFFFLQFC
jgi:hypothetical protein